MLQPSPGEKRFIYILRTAKLAEDNKEAGGMSTKQQGKQRNILQNASFAFFSSSSQIHFLILFDVYRWQASCVNSTAADNDDDPLMEMKSKSPLRQFEGNRLELSELNSSR